MWNLPHLFCIREQANWLCQRIKRVLAENQNRIASRLIVDPAF